MLRTPTAGGGTDAPPVVGLSLGSPTVGAADHLAHELVARLGAAGWLEGALVTTSVVRGLGAPQVALAVRAPACPPGELADLVGEAVPGAALSGESDERLALAASAAALGQESGGRAVHFPGVERLVGTLPVAEVLQVVDEVLLMGGAPADPSAPLVTGGHVRPLVEGDRLVLLVERVAGGAVVPFDKPDPNPCCAVHG